MKKISLIVAAIITGVYFFSCNSGNKEQTTDVKPPPTAFDLQKAGLVIDSLDAKFSEEFKKGDSIALAAQYVKDAEILFPGREPIKGKDILLTWGKSIRSAIKNSITDLIFKTTALKGNAEILIETGTFQMLDDKKNVKDKGKYVVVWEYENGQWKLYRDIGI